ncbi:MAG TPA: ABC transporter ATP-binding protein [Bryobacteraceae bacterium]|jgi:lipopolysaccharide transport system ATP-binding protein|nr:ABC transporter ATP-binding protein [Bryobacteraceae bacterium]
MAEIPIQFNNVWKKFTKGERFDSLRDLIPSTVKWLASKKHVTELEKKQFWALRDVSFELGKGESLAIIGPNGSGKSTTLKLLSRILKPDHGSITLRGRLGALIELGAGFHPDLTGRENIYLNGTILGMKRSEIDAKFNQIVEFSELSEFLDTPVKRYSSGMYARLGFSVACHVDPDVLLVDEVLSVGDYHFQQKCFDKMREFVQRGTTLIFISHNMTAVTSLCKSALVLRKGEAVYMGDVSTAVQKYHSFYDEISGSKEVQVISAQLRSGRGEEREVFHPGEEAVLEVRLQALQDLRNAHAALMIYTADGQFVFDTATSRLLANQRLNLKAGETATIVFHLSLNLRGGVFRLGFTVTPEVEVPGQFIYFNGSLKRLVMTSDGEANGIVHLNPKAELVLG